MAGKRYLIMSTVMVVQLTWTDTGDHASTDDMVDLFEKNEFGEELNDPGVFGKDDGENFFGRQ